MSRLFFILMLLFFGVLISDCGLFKNTSKSSKEVQAEASVFRFYGDSSSYEEEVLIWPKGTFSYSPGTGFFGEAEKVQLKEKGRKTVLAAEMSNLQYSAKEKLLVKESNLDWMFWVLICGFGIYLAFKFYKKWQV
ncbi:hypothetical protein [Pedobacter gandavensis]|uniref:Uncharacterized protein n=1 Tax=Pedobacter gandavensis TaxID=2679963 RepID=A0ABR6EXC9_9SPHI|nr:hypothetical protein [Pedobacter gandavensis]MBB2149914.1 hypothetical protein [Pedobacter gandavensis]